MPKKRNIYLVSKGMKWGLSKRIDGHTFLEDSSHNSKRDANKRAKELRKLQHRVRVLSSGRLYSVWKSVTARERRK